MPAELTAVGAIEIEFETGARMRITGTIDTATLTAAVAALSSDGDDPAANRGASVAHDRLHRHAEGLSLAGAAGLGDLATRSLERSSVLLPRTPRQPAEGDLARRPRRLLVHKAPGAGPVLVAEPGRRHGDDLIGTARLSVVRHRLAAPTADLAANIGWLTLLACGWWWM